MITPSNTTDFSIEDFPESRQFTMDIGQLGLKKHHVRALIEIDVTTACERIKKLKNSTKPISFTAWFVHSFACCLNSYPQLHSIKKGKNQRILFNEIDICLMVERVTKGQLVPLPYVLRNAGKKSVIDIQREIQLAKAGPIANENESSSVTKFALKLPRWLRLMVWKLILTNPLTVKKMMGTVLISSVGMTKGIRGWAIPVSIHPLAVTVGSIAKKPGVINDKIEIRQYLPITLLFDHDLVDGMPMARFVSYLTEALEKSLFFDLMD